MSAFYEVMTTLPAIGDAVWFVLSVCGGVLVAMTVWFQLAYRAGERDRLPSPSLLAIWELTKAVLTEPPYLGSFTIITVLSPFFGTTLIGRRGSGSGQSAGMWAASTMMAALWAIGSAVGFGATFHRPLWVLTVAASVIAGLVAMKLVALPAPPSARTVPPPVRAGA